MQVIFDTERLFVRPYLESDSENFFLLNGDARVMQYIRPVKTRTECDAFLKEVIHDSQASGIYGRWAVIEKRSGAFVGSFAVIPVERSDRMQLGYALLPSYWNKGFATELTDRSLHYVFGQTPIETIFAYTEKDNWLSKKVLCKCGFRFVESIQEGEKELLAYCFSKKDFNRDL